MSIVPGGVFRFCPDCGLAVVGMAGQRSHFGWGCPVRIVELFKRGMSITEIADRFGRKEKTINEIIREALR